MDESDGRSAETRRRRLIYLVFLLLIVAALVLPLPIEFPYAQEAVECHQLIEGLPERPRVFLVADLAPTGDRSEGERQLRALVRHLLDRGARIVSACTEPGSAQVVDVVVREGLGERRLTYGDAAINLGARPGGGVAFIFSCAADFARGAEGRDHQGEDLELMPLIHSFRWLGSGDLLVWIGDAKGVPLDAAASLAGQYGMLALAAGTGTAGADAVGLAQDGRVSAALPGGGATADYEALCAGRGPASRQRFALTLGILFALALIIWAYVSGWLARPPRRRRADGGI